MSSPAKDRVLIFDTTLRDGEQSPGASMTLEEKLLLANALKELRVDIIEAGFPIASPGDFAAVQAIARKVQGPTICGLARCNPDDIDRAGEAIADAENRRIHVFLATSQIHREHKLKMAKEEIVKRTAEGVSRAKGFCDDIEFSPEDAARTEPEFVAEVVEKAIEAGATTLNIPDTVGFAVPEQYGALIAYLKKNVRGIDDVIISTHTHNDLGLAVANSLAGVEAGARQVECTINGIGERAGNCSLEEIVMALKTRADYFGYDTGIETTRLYPTSRMVSKVTGLAVQHNKAVVGENAFAHEAGIHQHGMLMHHETYEIMRPENVGFGATNLVLGKHSGRHAFRQRVIDLGFDLDDEALNRVFADFKRLCDKKKEVYDADIEALIESGTMRGPEVWTIEQVNAVAGTATLPTAGVVLRHSSGEIKQASAWGDGPVDAVLNAMKQIVDLPMSLKDFRLQAVTQSQKAQGEVTVEVEYQGGRHRGRGVSTDIVEASAQAFLNVLNRVAAKEKAGQPEQVEIAAATKGDAG